MARRFRHKTALGQNIFVAETSPGPARQVTSVAFALVSAQDSFEARIAKAPSKPDTAIPSPRWHSLETYI